MNRVVILPEYALELDFSTVPAVMENWKQVSVTQTEGLTHCIYTAGGFILQVWLQQEPECKSIDFLLQREDKAAFTVESYTIECLVPALDVYNVSPRFMGYAHVSHQNGPTVISSCTSKDFPYVMYGSRSGENRFAIGMENQIIETEMTRHGKGQFMYYDSNVIRFRRPIGGVTLHRNELRDAIFISDAHKSWFHVTRDYWDWIDMRRNYIPNPTPESAYGPVWCSWMYLTDINEEKIWESAKAAKELGIRTVAVDAGWFCSDTDIPFADSPLSSDTIGFGRIDPDPAKFPDMAGLVKRIHEELGLFVWAWATPRWVFRAVEQGEKAVDRELLDCRIVTDAGETVPLLCTRNPGAREHAARFTKYLLETYGFDGLKFDCWELDADMAVCTADHPHTHDTMGEGTIEWAKGIHDAMTSVRPDVVVWLNNTTTKQYSNYSVSPNEIYCHPDENWRMSVVLKTFTKGIASQLCEGSWHREEADKNVARQLAILMMGHTPELQVNLLQLKESHKQLIQAWFSFYEQHKYELLQGDYEPLGFESMLGGPISTTPPNVRIEGQKEGFIWLGPVHMDEVTFTKPLKRMYFFNQKNKAGIRILVTGLPQGTVTVTQYDIFLRAVQTQTYDCNGAFLLDSNVEEGGAVQLIVDGEDS